MWRFSTLPIIYHPEWRPTSRWAARVLGVYAIAALCGGLLFVIYTLLFVPPRETLTNPIIPPEIGAPTAPKIRAPTAPPDTVIETSPLVANTQESVKLIAIANLLENKDKDPKAIMTFIDRERLQEKYPLGFALFYADGRKTLYYIKPASSSGISFDPSSLEMIRKGDMYCMNILPIRINGRLMDNIKVVCATHTMHIVNFGNIYLDLEPLATTNEGAAWVLGMRPAT